MKHEIYISYADADEDWVTCFTEDLRRCLRGQLGKISDNFIWARFMLRGIDNAVETPREHLKNSKWLLVILSNAYLREIGSTDIDLFGHIDNIIVVEHDEVVKPKELKSKVGYQFWEKDEKGNFVRYGYPKPVPDKAQNYFQLLDNMARDIAEKISLSATKNTTQDEENRTTMFLAKTSKYSRERVKLRKYFIDKGFTILPTKNYKGNDYIALDKDLEESDFFVQLFDDEEMSQKQCEQAKAFQMPILIWCEQDANRKNIASCPKPISMDIVSFKFEIEQWINDHNSKLDDSNDGVQENNLTIFINFTKEDHQLALQIQNQLKNEKISSILSPIFRDIKSFSK